MPEKVVMFSPLGGVGRTTLAINLACQLAKSASVHLIDADEFGAAWHWSSFGRLPVPVQQYPLTCPSQTQQWTQTLSAITADMLVVDLPSKFGSASLAALMVADSVVVPIQASHYGLHVGTLAVDHLKRVFAAKLDGSPMVLLIPSQVDRRSFAGRGITGTLSKIGEKVGPSVGWRAAFQASAGFYEWVGTIAPGSRAHREIIALAATVRRNLAAKAAVVAVPGVVPRPPRP